MQDGSPVEPAPPAADAGADGLSTEGLRPAVRLAMVVLGYVPLLHVLACLAMALVPLSVLWRVTLAVAILYLAPPLLARAIPVRPGVFAMSLPWWATNQLQVVFNRLPFLEELLRIVPTLYSFWLRLWGARVGSLVYWSPGVLVADRSLLRVGNRAMIGGSARMVGHLFQRDAKGALQLTVAPVTIGAGAIVGAWSILGPGSIVDDDAVVPATMPLPPHSRWTRDDRRYRGRPRG